MREQAEAAVLAALIVGFVAFAAYAGWSVVTFTLKTECPWSNHGMENRSDARCIADYGPARAFNVTITRVSP